MAIETNANRAYQHLRNKLIAGDFEPGSRLLYGPIGKEIGVSATPVREAAGQLANEGLVDLVPNMGAIVCSLNRNDLIEIYEVREVIEPATAALAAQRIIARQLAQIEKELSDMRALTVEHRQSERKFAGKRISKRFDKADYQFHKLIVEATGNQALMRTASQSHVLTLVFGIRQHAYTSAGMQRTCDEHERILAAIRTGNAEQARAASAAHIQRGLLDSLATIDEQAEAENAD
ncbi:GntR family transcriptional regulator [Novipirellula artificiosorum]|uniref:HTH-type transcriptional regulator LutR n=1 Tax=Novipirellula artificiosorum TaxID=2528016 RepID=A0A5C6D330_9BACT|nr:GntR family transcriptional regulator [Novipirellula artificiosorum]TWU31342.1 HTH-type transcriptional regulator LutR [Novipirellula artificiosorum]